MKKRSLSRLLYLERRKLGHVVLFILVAISVPYFVSALGGFWDFLTGAGTTDTTSVSISINAAPLIDFVEARNVTPITVLESTISYVNISFSAQDPDGIGQLVNTTAAIIINTSTGASRYNFSCKSVGHVGSSVNYSCLVYLWYFDRGGDWTINVSVQDTNGTIGTNMTKTFALQTLTSMVMYPSSLSWPSMELGATNKTSASDPIVVNNTGNKNVTNGGMSITANDLQGLTTTTEFITARNFSIGSFNGSVDCSGVSCLECNRTLGLNNTAQPIVIGNISPNNNSIDNFFGETSGQETLYVCLRSVATQLSRQTYDTSGSSTGSWTVTVS